MENNETAQTSALVVAPNVRGAREAMQQFEQLKAQVLRDNDAMLIEGKPYIKRSGWRKIALAFNVTTEVIRTYPIKQEDRIIGYTVEAKASAPNGRYAMDQASCELSEIKGGPVTHHNCITRATTRALNRAISDLCGGGEVSAEEMADTQEPKKEHWPITTKQVGYAKGLAQKAGADAEALAMEQYKKPLDQISMDQAKELIDYLKSRQPQVGQA